MGPRIRSAVRSALFLAVGLALVWPVVVSAQPLDDRARYQQGVQLYQAGRCDEAAVVFEQLSHARPTPTVLLSLAGSLRCRGDHVRAATVLEGLLAAPTPMAEGIRAQAQSALDDERRALVSLTVHPEQATVRVDEQPATRSPAGFYLLTPGEHRVDVRAEGFVAHAGTERYSPGTRPRLVLAAQPSAPLRVTTLLTPAAPLPAPTADAHMPPASVLSPVQAQSRSRVPWAVVIPVGVLVVAGAVTAVVLLSADTPAPERSGTFGSFATY
jgi:hypothetical protein